jgi:hypothetical protein
MLFSQYIHQVVTLPVPTPSLIFLKDKTHPETPNGTRNTHVMAKPLARRSFTFAVLWQPKRTKSGRLNHVVEAVVLVSKSTQNRVHSSEIVEKSESCEALDSM